MTEESYQERYARTYTMNTRGKKVMVDWIGRTLRYKCTRGLLVDVGSGLAEIEPRVTKLGYKYFGVDINPFMLARSNSKEKLAQADALNLPLENNCASVVLMNMLVHSIDNLWSLDMAIEEADRVLAKDGRLIITMLTERKTRDLVNKESLNIDTRPKPITYIKDFSNGELVMEAFHWRVDSVLGIMQMCSFKPTKQTKDHFELIVGRRNQIYSTLF